MFDVSFVNGLCFLVGSAVGVLLSSFFVIGGNGKQENLNSTIDISPQKDVVNIYDSEVESWLLARKIEAGRITSNALDKLDGAKAGCETVLKGLNTLEEIKDRLMKLFDYKPIRKALETPGIDGHTKGYKGGEKEISELNAIKEISQLKTIMMPMIQQVDLSLTQARNELRATGWLSDLPPGVRGKVLDPEVEVKRAFGAIVHSAPDILIHDKSRFNQSELLETKEISTDFAPKPRIQYQDSDSNIIRTINEINPEFWNKADEPSMNNGHS